jgi:hypothetical protein
MKQYTEDYMYVDGYMTMVPMHPKPNKTRGSLCEGKR